MLGAQMALYGLLVVACSTCRSSQPSTVDTAAADAELRDYQLRALEARVQAMTPGPERTYYTGMLAARSGRFDEAISELGRALPQIRGSQPNHAAAALEALATAFRATNQYGDAASAYADLSEHFSGQLEHFPADDAALARILSGTPAQSILWSGPVILETTSNPLGSRSADLTINGIRASWLLDTGANQSVVTRSFARRLGLTPLRGTAPVGSGVTGRQIEVQVTVLPALPLGGATLTNVVLLIVDDANLRIGFGADAYQIDAILGYPVFRSLGVITFTRRDLRAGDAAEQHIQGARMYMRGLTPAIECAVDGQPLLFTFDTGASSTDLSVRYYELFRKESSAWKKRTGGSAGAGGSISHDVYVQPRVVMKVGDATATLRDVSIMPSRMNAGIDILFGNLGQDFVDGFERFTLDFRTMTFAFGAPRSQ
jgi:predicted aspartyl protease